MSLPFDQTQIETLVAVVDTGTFDAAAQRLGVSPSAVSQRIKALENTTGAVLVRRSTPCTATSAGEPLLRLGRQVSLLRQDAWAELRDADVVQLPLAVEPDSLRTWFGPVMSEVATWPRTALSLTAADAADSAALLRRGEVVAAVTTDPEPIQGCDVEPLGIMMYVAAAAPPVIERHRAGSVIDWATMPFVTLYGASVHDQVDPSLASEGPRVAHRLPNGEARHDAIRLGLGWGFLPAAVYRDGESSGLLAGLPRSAIEVPLFWHRWRLDTPTLIRIDGAVRRAAAAQLATKRAPQH